MKYIDFYIVDDEILYAYIYGYGEKKIKLSSDSLSDSLSNIFALLSKDNFSCKEFIIDGRKIIRYYDVEQILFNNMKKNNFLVKKKVNRVNKYIGGTIVVGGALLLLLLLLLYKQGPFKPNNDSQDKKLTKNVTVSVDVKGIPSHVPSSMKPDVIIPDRVFEFEYEDRSNSNEATLARNLYTDVVTRNSNTYGLPSNLMLAIGTQERGTHSTEVSPGGGFGLFQIQVENGWNWVGKPITAYNFDLGKIETVVVCQKEDGSIDVNMLADLEYNTKVACMIMAYDLSYCDYDLIAALQSYNSGTQVSFLKKEYGEDWINYRENLPGDPLYLEHVLSYIPEDNSLLQYKDPSGKEYVVDINNVYVDSLNKTR